MYYELWDLRSGNIINTYDSEAEALTVVRGLVELNGSDYADVLSLSVSDDDDNVTLVAKGTALARRAQILKDAV
jgi:redox-sensitive bicupin YhaK (pirin superfamily)